jgi:hypothetical protein
MIMILVHLIAHHTIYTSLLVILLDSIVYSVSHAEYTEYTSPCIVPHSGFRFHPYGQNKV